MFDPREMFTAGPCFFVGSTGSGKTNTLLSVIAANGRKFETMAAFAGSVGSVLSLGKCLPGLNIHCPYDNKAVYQLQKLIDQQQRDVFNGSAEPLLLIFDDLMFEGHQFVNSREFRWLIFNSRASKIWCMFTMQYCKHVPPEIRSQGFYAFLCAAKDPETRGMLATTFAPIGCAGGFRNERHFYKKFDKYTSGQGCMVVDRSILGPLGEDHPPYYKYRPPLINWKIPIGSGYLWMMNKMKYNPKWANHADAFRMLSAVPDNETPRSSSRRRSDRPNSPPRAPAPLPISMMAIKRQRVSGFNPKPGEYSREKAKSIASVI